jgi:hypothetical protein
MELLPLIRLIWRRRLLLTAGILAAAAMLVALGGTHAVATHSALAWTGVTLDTPKSQLLEAAPPGAETLTWRAALLSHLMATGTSTKQLAQRLGVAPNQVAVIDPTLTLPAVFTDTAQAAAKAAASATAAPYVVTVLSSPSVPVISLQAAAPDRVHALRLAEAAVAVLQAQASPGGRFTSRIPTDLNSFKRQPFVVGQIAPLRVKSLSSSTLPIKAIGVPFFLLFVWFAGVLTMPRLASRMRLRSGALPA